jgi:DNA-binding transcriptional LysR family regulator
MLGVWRLQLLREVESRGTIKAAAAAMSVTPSAVSQQLAILEREAGTPLLEKHGRRVRLTNAGSLLVRHAHIITGAIAAAEADLASTMHLVAGTLRVAAFPTAARAIMPSVITAVSRLYPTLRITLRDLEATESLSALRLDEIDLAIVDDYGDTQRFVDEGLEIRHLFDDPLYLASTPIHPGSRTVKLSQLRDAFWIMDTESSHLFQAVLQACRASGFNPQIRSNCKDFSVIIALVEAGLGVGILPGLALHDRSVRAGISQTNPQLIRRVAAVIRPERRGHPAVAFMLSELDRFGASYSAGSAGGSRAWPSSTALPPHRTP